MDMGNVRDMIEMLKHSTGIYDPSEMYQLKGNRVILTSRKRTLKVNYDDFFKISLEKNSRGKVNDIKFFQKNGVDVIAFIIYGMVSMLSNTPVKNGGSEDYLEVGSCLDEFSDYIKSKYTMVTTVEGFNEMFKRFSVYNNVDSIDKLSKKEIDILAQLEHPSYFLGVLFGGTYMENEMHKKLELLSHLYALSMAEDGCKIIADIFCRFSTYMGSRSIKYFPNLFSKEYKEVLKDMSTILNDVRVGDYCKFKFNGSLSVSDIQGISVLLCAKLADYVVGVDLLTDSDSLEKQINELLGNDIVKDYLVDGNIRKVIRTRLHNKSYAFNPPINKSNSLLENSIEIDESKFSVGVSVLWKTAEMCKCIVNNNLDYRLCDLMDSLSCDIFSMRSACSLVARNILSHKDAIDAFNNEEITEVMDKYESTINNQINLISNYEESLRSKDSEIEKLKSELKDAKAHSGDIDVDEYNNLKKELEYVRLRNETLEEKVTTYKDRMSNIEGSMEDLIFSLSAESSEELGVSDEEMIGFLNGFNILFIGGRTDMIPKLQDMGWCNVTQISNVSELIRSNLNSYDFVVTMTRFISHTLFHSTLNRGVERDRNMYFNNTNLNQLLNSCYDFVYSYLSK